MFFTTFSSRYQKSIAKNQQAKFKWKLICPKMLNDAVVEHHKMVFGFGFQRMIYLMSIYGENGIKQSVWYGMLGI